MYSTTQVAEFLGIRFYRILYAHKVNHVDEPERVGGNRAYTKQEVLKLAVHFGINQNKVLERVNHLDPKGSGLEKSSQEDNRAVCQ